MNPEHREIILNNLDILVNGTTDLDRVLDRLVEKNVFNDFMVNLIKSGETEQKMKREMYIRLTKRGPEAFSKLYDTLWIENYKNLAALLRPRKCHEEDSPDHSPITSCVIPGQIRMDQNKDKVYKMGSNPKGYALIINFNKYLNNLFPERVYSRYDEEILDSLWKDLGYEVELYKDLDYKTTFQVLDTFRRKKELERVDSIIIYIMTSVEIRNKYEFDETCVYPVDGIGMKVDKIIEMFDSMNCRQLSTKPKLFFFQNFGCIKNGTLSSHINFDFNILPNMADMLTVNYFFVESSDFDQESGSIFPKALSNVFRARAHENDIITMIEEVSRNLRKFYHENEGQPYLRWARSGFDKDLYFHPGLYD